MKFTPQLSSEFESRFDVYIFQKFLRVKKKNGRVTIHL